MVASDALRSDHQANPNPANATIADGQGQGTIIDDDVVVPTVTGLFPEALGIGDTFTSAAISITVN